MTTSATSVAWWRKWHRWIAFPASIFLLWAAATGVVVAFTEFFGEEEARREAARNLVSPVSTTTESRAWSEPVAAALARVAQQIGAAPVDSIAVAFKGDPPTVTVFTGKRGGGEDRKFVVNARTGELIKVEAYADKPFLNRLHSGESFGDGGLVMAMAWALTLVVLTVTGLIIYFILRPKRRAGMQNIFW